MNKGVPKRQKRPLKLTKVKAVSAEQFPLDNLTEVATTCSTTAQCVFPHKSHTLSHNVCFKELSAKKINTKTAPFWNKMKGFQLSSIGNEEPRGNAWKFAAHLRTSLELRHPIPNKKCGGVKGTGEISSFCCAALFVQNT